MEQGFKCEFETLHEIWLPQEKCRANEISHNINFRILRISSWVMQLPYEFVPISFRINNLHCFRQSWPQWFCFDFILYNWCSHAITMWSSDAVIRNSPLNHVTINYNNAPTRWYCYLKLLLERNIEHTYPTTALFRSCTYTEQVA